jgi:hypothetical protein
MRPQPLQPAAAPTRRLIAVRRWLVPGSILVVASLLAIFTTITSWYITATPDVPAVQVGPPAPRGTAHPMDADPSQHLVGVTDAAVSARPAYARPPAPSSSHPPTVYVTKERHSGPSSSAPPSVLTNP